MFELPQNQVFFLPKPDLSESIVEYGFRCETCADDVSPTNLSEMSDTVMVNLEVLPTGCNHGNTFSSDRLIFTGHHQHEIKEMLDQESMVREAWFLVNSRRVPVEHFGRDTDYAHCKTPAFQGLLPTKSNSKAKARSWQQDENFAVQQLAFGRALFRAHKNSREESAHKKNVIATYAKLVFLSDSEALAKGQGPDMHFFAREFEAALEEAEHNFAPWRAMHRASGVELRSALMLKKLEDFKAM